MGGISSKAAGSLINKKGYNGNELQSKEFSDGSGLELYDFNARTYDQQIGRFIQIDPESEEADQESWTPYHFTFDNPINHSDPDGTIPIPLIYRAYRIIRFIYKEVPWSRNTKDLPVATKDNANAIIRVVTPILKDLLTPQVVTTPEAKKTETTKIESKKTEIESKINELNKSNRTLDKRINEHKEKLNEYKKDPDKYDNKGILKDKTPEQRQEIIDGRVKHLEHEIKTFKDNMNKNNEKVKSLQNELK